MKKGFKVYALIWIIAVAVFNIICFVTPDHIAGDDKIDAAFWTGYVFISLAFIGNLICAGLAFRADSLKKLFYSIPLITISYAGLIVMIVAGGLCMGIPNLPAWVGVVVCTVVLAFHAVSVIQARAAAEVVETIDAKASGKIQFIKALTVDAENIMRRAANDEQKEACKRVFEAARYSDPVSSDSLITVETQIRIKMDELSAAVNDEDDELVAVTANDLLLLVKDRNQMAKMLKA